MLILLLFLLLIIVLNLGTTGDLEYINNHLNISLQNAQVVMKEEDKGWNGDGIIFYKIEVSDSEFITQLTETDNWTNYKTDKITEYFNNLSYCLKQEELPDIKEAYYYFRNKKDVVSPYDGLYMDYILAVYDVEKCELY